MKKVVVALLGSMLAFGLGLAGVFFSLPLLAPDQVTAVVGADSLQAADSLNTAGGADSLAVPDTSLAWPGAPSLVVEEGVAAALRDSLAQLLQKIDLLQQDKEALSVQVEELQRQLDAAVQRRVEAKDVSATLTKLEEKDLAALVERLDPYVLKLLYEEASGRNRSRLLQALPADGAARFVQHLIDPVPAPPSEAQEVEADTLATSQPALSETAAPDRLP